MTNHQNVNEDTTPLAKPLDLSRREVSLNDFDWGSLDLSSHTASVVSLLRQALTDGSDASAALARAIEGVEAGVMLDRAIGPIEYQEMCEQASKLQDLARRAVQDVTDEWLPVLLDALAAGIDLWFERQQCLPSPMACRETFVLMRLARYAFEQQALLAEYQELKAARSEAGTVTAARLN